MKPLVIENDVIADLALDVTQAVLAKSEEARAVMEDPSGPLDLARALADFFPVAGALENGAAHLDQEHLQEFCAYGLDLLDRLAFLVRKVEIMDKRDPVARMFLHRWGFGSLGAAPPSITWKAPPTASA